MKVLAAITDAVRGLRGDVGVVIAQFGRQDILFHAGSVAYSALLAAAPFFLLLASVAGFILGPDPVASDAAVQEFLRQLLPASSAEAARPILHDVLADLQTRRGTLGVVSALAFAWFSTRFFGAIRGSLTSVFDVERGRGIVAGKLFDMMYVLAGTLLATIYLGINTFVALGTDFGRAFLQAAGFGGDAVSFLMLFIARFVSVSFLAMMFVLVYKFVPNRRVDWDSALWGGVWGAVLFELLRSVIFELITRVVSPSSVYSGTLAAAAVIVFWAYYAAVVFLIGGVVARVHEVRGRRIAGSDPGR